MIFALVYVFCLSRIRSSWKSMYDIRRKQLVNSIILRLSWVTCKIFAHYGEKMEVCSFVLNYKGILFIVQYEKWFVYLNQVIIKLLEKQV